MSPSPPAPPPAPDAPQEAPPRAARQISAAAERNKGPILAELQRLLPPRGALLELASGTGQHGAHAVPALPDWTWQPSDANAQALASIRAWAATLAGTPHAARLLPPRAVDLLSPDWLHARVDGAQQGEAAGRLVPGPFDALFTANLLHISPWPVCRVLMLGAARRLRPGGLLLVYGPFKLPGQPLGDGNAAFDADLRQRNPAWGLRDLDAVQAEAAAAGLQWRERVAMPANNQLLVLAAGPALTR